MCSIEILSNACLLQLAASTDVLSSTNSRISACHGGFKVKNTAQDDSPSRQTRNSSMKGSPTSAKHAQSESSKRYRSYFAESVADHSRINLSNSRPHISLSLRTTRSYGRFDSHRPTPDFRRQPSSISLVNPSLSALPIKSTSTMQASKQKIEFESQAIRVVTYSIAINEMDKARRCLPPLQQIHNRCHRHTLFPAATHAERI